MDHFRHSKCGFYWLVFGKIQQKQQICCLKILSFIFFLLGRDKARIPSQSRKRSSHSNRRKL